MTAERKVGKLRLVDGLGKREEQDRDGVGEGGGDTGEGVFGAWPVLHGEDAGGLAVGDTGVAVGHVDADAFLTADDGADAGGDGVFDDRGGRKAEQSGGALALEDVDDGIGCSHGSSPGWLVLLER